MLCLFPALALGRDVPLARNASPSCLSFAFSISPAFVLITMGWHPAGPKSTYSEPVLLGLNPASSIPYLCEFM